MSGDEAQRSTSAQRRAALKSRRESQEASGSVPPKPASRKGKDKYYAHVYTDDTGRDWTHAEVKEYERRTGEGEAVTYDQVRADLQQAQAAPSPPADLAVDKAPTSGNERSRTASSSLSPLSVDSPVAAKKITLKFNLSGTGNKGKGRQIDEESAAEEPPRKKRQTSPAKKKTTKNAGSSPVKKAPAPRKNFKKTGRVLSDSDSDEGSEPALPPRTKSKTKPQLDIALGDEDASNAKSGPPKAVKSLKEKKVGGQGTPKSSGLSTPLETQPGTVGMSTQPGSPAVKASAEGVERKTMAKTKRTTHNEGSNEGDETPPTKKAKTKEKEKEKDKVKEGELAKDKVKVKSKKEQGEELPASSKVKRDTADTSGTPKIPRQQISGTFKKTATPSSGAKKPLAKTASDAGGLIGGIYKNLLGKGADGQKPQIAANGRVVPAAKKMLYRDTKLTDQEEQQYIARKEAREEDVKKRSLSLSDTFDLEESGNLVREFERAPRCIPGLTPSLRFGEGGELIEALLRSRSARVQ